MDLCAHIEAELLAGNLRKSEALKQSALFLHGLATCDAYPTERQFKLLQLQALFLAATVVEALAHD